MSNTGAAAGVTVGRAAGGTGGDADAWSCNEPLDGIKVVAVGVANPWKLLKLGDGVHLHAVAQCVPADNEPCNSVSGSWPLYSVRDVLQHLPAALNVTAEVAKSRRQAPVRRFEIANGHLSLYKLVDSEGTQLQMVDILGVFWLASEGQIGDATTVHAGGSYCDDLPAGETAPLRGDNGEDHLGNAAIHLAAAERHRMEAMRQLGLAAAETATSNTLRIALQNTSSFTDDQIDVLVWQVEEGQELHCSLELPQHGKSAKNLTVRQRNLVLQHRKTIIKDEEGDGRQLIMEIMARDPCLLIDALAAQDGHGVRESIKLALIAEVRPALDLLTGLISLRISKRTYDTEILGLANTLRSSFVGASFLLPRTYGRKAVAQHVPPLPKFSVTVDDATGTVGVSTTVGCVLDFLATFPSWRRSLRGNKNSLGLLVWTDGFPFLHSGGATVTVCVLYVQE
jgi:hypothetical protein